MTTPTQAHEIPRLYQYYLVRFVQQCRDKRQIRPSKIHISTILIFPWIRACRKSEMIHVRMWLKQSRKWKLGLQELVLVCAETLDDLYYHRVPLPRIPGCHTLDKQARLADVHDRHESTTYAHAASNTWHARFTSLLQSISKTGPANYYSRLQLQALHNPNR